MSYSDDTSDQESNDKMRKSSRIRSAHKKQKYAQKFLDKWLKIFDPWLERCESDPDKAFCKACKIKLDSNRCHLHRHETTVKHKKNLDILLSRNVIAAEENLTVRQERTKYYQQRDILKDEVYMDCVEGYLEENDVLEDEDSQYPQEESEFYCTEQPIKRELEVNQSLPPYHTQKHQVKDKTKSPVKNERMKVLMQIQKDKNDLMASFKELMGSNINAVHTPVKEKNHIDLFFESVSSSVKALTPKLIAEAKMRVSQLIGELELRALTELESQCQGSQIDTVGSTHNYVVN